jgi:predicted nucleotidyltransferase
MQSLNDLLQRLADSGIEFVVIGGYAGVLHGSAYVTRALHICAVLTAENIERLRDCLRDLNPRHRMTAQELSFLQIPPPGTPVNNLYLRTDWGVVDILSSVLGLGGLERLKANAEEIEIGGKRCQLIGLEDLILAKDAIGRDKDRLAAIELRAIAEKRAQQKKSAGGEAGAQS